ncbi:pyrimidine 5'-nucleotidase [Halocynthiibacter sp. C4]|uniref:pyrimidine 5'-nucleotidase n=1 Tax=Halocynthiibacter sp. C4 TaxID=2992758 RepID=UPI00237BAC8E|nr:pyrimidine 5'-nucleotidase [Halocynthiibacter sp. C4]MDE0590103.1 pyrimidine 5'-nucleotidase [Halocynthiibacter sp. C4]
MNDTSHLRGPAADFTHVSQWVFDLDNTLYPPEDALFSQIEVRMTDYVMQALNVPRHEANHLRQHYWRTYGTTLAGLMDEHGVDPAPYLTHVHEISLDHMQEDLELSTRIKSLPGRKIVFTNGTAPYAERVLAARGLSGLFDAVYGVEHANFRPKPERRAFEAVFTRDGIAPEKAAMFEDDPRNLQAPHEMGMRTIHVAPVAERAAHIHHHTDDLSGFLSRILDAKH